MGVTFDGVVGSGADTITLGSDVPASTPSVSRLLVAFGAAKAPTSGSPGVVIASADDDAAVRPAACYAAGHHTDFGHSSLARGCRLQWQPLFVSAVTSLGFSDYGLYAFFFGAFVTRDMPSGVVVALTPDADSEIVGSGVALFEGVAYGEAFPEDQYQSTSNGATDDCSGGFWKSQYAAAPGNFPYGGDVGLLLGSTAAHGFAQTCDHGSVGFLVGDLASLDPGHVSGWGLTALAEYEIDVTTSHTFGGGTIASVARISLGYKIVSGPGSIDYGAQWACPGHCTFSGSPVYRRLFGGHSEIASIAALGDGEGIPCCPAAPQVRARFRPGTALAPASASVDPPRTVRSRIRV